MKFKLHNISFINEGRKIVYDYSFDPKIKSYFNANNPYYVLYDQDISDTPLSLAIIPLIANIMPMSWFVGFDVYIDEIDETFLNSLNILKEHELDFL